MIRRPAAFLWLRLGQWLASRGMAPQAEACYRHAGHSDPEGYYLLGKSLLSRDRLVEATHAFQRATVLAPGHARAWCGLGAAQRRAADMESARQSYERALAIDPQLPQALNNLGEWLLVQGQTEAALDCFDRLLSRQPDFYEALTNRVATLFECGRYREAETAARDAVERYPERAPLYVNLANVLLYSDQAREAIRYYRKALELDPACEEAHINLSVWLGDSSHMLHAIDYLRHQIAIKGESAPLLASLALAQQTKGDLSDAERTSRKALQLQPANISALITLAGCVSARADHRQAIALHEQALAINPQMSSIHSNILFDLTYLPEEPAERVFARHCDWAERFEQPLRAKAHPHAPEGDPERRLKVGYVSGDFKGHPVGFLLRDVIRWHDPAQFEVVCYSMVRKEDDITAEIRNAAHLWRDEVLTADADLAAKILDDRIDILVDLSGHTAYHRLPVFALRPAPVQATWIGYFHSTGLSGIDYFITDPHTSPPGCGQLFSETPVYLPHSRFCYSPPDYAPEVAELPALASGGITFGSFNRIEKLVEPVVAAWAAIVLGTPGSRLLIKAGALADAGTAEDLRRRFAAHGLAADRLSLRGPSGHQDMLGQYGDIDIALDTFPFNGGMTTLEALWMGVPVVTITGEGVVSRQTLSVLENIDASELIFANVDAYVRGAIALASDVPGLARGRQQLRPKMAASPIRRAEQFTRDLEALYRRMWRARCADTRLASDIRTA